MVPKDLFLKDPSKTLVPNGDFVDHNKEEFDLTGGFRNPMKTLVSDVCRPVYRLSSRALSLSSSRRSSRASSYPSFLSPSPPSENHRLCRPSSYPSLKDRPIRRSDCGCLVLTCFVLGLS